MEIYKFRGIPDWNNPEDNTIQSIQDAYMYFNAPSNFNDPFDCRYKVELSDNIEKVREYFDYGSRLDPRTENLSEKERQKTTTK